MADSDGKGRDGLRGQVQGVWQRMSSIQRVVTVGIIVAVVAAFAWVMLGGNSAKMVPLARGLSAEDEAVAVAALEEAKIPYQLDSGGTILVPEAQVHDARLEIAVSTSPGGKVVGFELFDESELGRSAFSEKVNYHRAMEGELARTIRHLKPVEKARVHLVIPERRLFEQDQAEPSASVVLELAAGASLSPRQVLAVRHLVASAVERLVPDRVAIVDQSGTMLARPDGEEGGGTEGLFEKQVGFERGLERRVVELLEPMVGIGNVRAQVSARLDFSKVVETSEKFDPEVSVVRSERTREETSKSANLQATGQPGTSSNLPGGAGTTGGRQQGNESERSDKVVNYEIDRQTQRRETPNARVERLSVAVVINGAEEKDAVTGDLNYVPRTQDDMNRYQSIVQSAVGFDTTRGDQVSVTNVRFVRLEEEELEGSPEGEGVLATPWVKWVAIGAGVLALLLVVFLVLRARRKAAAEARVAAAARAAQLAARVAEEEDAVAHLLEPAGGEPTISDKVQLLRQRAIEQARVDIRRTASVMRGWLGQEISG